MKVFSPEISQQNFCQDWIDCIDERLLLKRAIFSANEKSMRKKFERILLTYAKVTVIEIQRLNNLITLILHYYEFNCCSKELSY